MFYNWHFWRAFATTETRIIRRDTVRNKCILAGQFRISLSSHKCATWINWTHTSSYLSVDDHNSIRKLIVNVSLYCEVNQSAHESRTLKRQKLQSCLLSPLNSICMNALLDIQFLLSQKAQYFQTNLLHWLHN